MKKKLYVHIYCHRGLVVIVSAIKLSTET